MNTDELANRIQESENLYLEYRTWLVIDKQELDQEIIDHAQKYGSIMEELADAKDGLLPAAIRNKSKVFSDTSLHFYSKKRDGKAPTKDIVEKETRANKTYIQAANLADRAQHTVSLWEGLAKAFADRGARMRLLVDLMSATAGTNFVRIETDRSKINRTGMSERSRKRKVEI